MTDIAVSPSAGSHDLPWLGSIRQALEFLENRQHDETIRACEQALEIDPRCPEALHVLGLVNFDLDDPTTALKLIQAAHEINPEVLEFAEGLAALYATLGNVPESLYYAKLGSILEPHPELEGLLPERFGTFFFNLERGRSDLYLGAAERRLRSNQPKRAVAACETQLELTPGDIPTLRLLAEASLRLGEVGRSIAAMQAVVQDPDSSVDDQVLLGEALSAAGRHEAARACHRAAVTRAPADPAIGSRCLATALCDPSLPAAAIERLHADWHAAHGAGIERRLLATGRSRDPNAPLRIGYIGSRFHDPSFACLLEPVLQCHDRNAVQIYCYADGGDDDAVGERIMRYADRWTDINRIDDETLWEILRGDAIDITVDLTGHGRHSRALVLARRPSPVTVAWLGYQHPPGQPQIDYFLTGARAWPSELPDPASGERLWRLAEGPCTFLVPSLIPEIEAPPAQVSGNVTFGAQTDLRLVSPDTARLWSELLRAVPGSRLLISNALNLDQDVIERCAEHFSLFGVRDRIDIVNPKDNFETGFDFYRYVDIALDTAVVNGLVETCYALWMGVPLVSLAGDRHAGRIVSGILHAAGLAEWAAESEPAFIETASRLARDLDELAARRASQRQRLAQSPFGQPQLFVAGLEQAYRAMWRDRLENGTAAA